MNRLTYNYELTQWEENRSEVEGSLLWGLYRTIPTLIVYKVGYFALFLKKGWSCTKKRFLWLSEIFGHDRTDFSTFRPRTIQCGWYETCGHSVRAFISKKFWNRFRTPKVISEKRMGRPPHPLMGSPPHHLPMHIFQLSASTCKYVDGTKLAGIPCEHLYVTFIGIDSELQKLYRKNAWGGLPIAWGGHGEAENQLLQFWPKHV
jgi:hypothetical protein